MSEAYREAVSTLAFIVAMVNVDIEDGLLSAHDDTVLLSYSSGGASAFLTLGMARTIANEDPCQD